jgi:hypothetical protein
MDNLSLAQQLSIISISKLSDCVSVENRSLFTLMRHYREMLLKITVAFVVAVILTLKVTATPPRGDLFRHIELLTTSS